MGVTVTGVGVTVSRGEGGVATIQLLLKKCGSLSQDIDLRPK